MFWTTFVTTSRLILCPDPLPGPCLHRKGNTTKTTYGSLPESLSQLLYAAECVTAAKVKLRDLSVTSLVLLLQPEHDPGHLGVELHQPVLVALSEHDDGAHRGEDGASEDADCDHRVRSDQAPDQGCAKNRAKWRL